MRVSASTMSFLKRFLFSQLMVVFGIPLLFLFSGYIAAYSALIGAVICFIPNLYFAYRTFQYRGARAAKKILNSFYAGESVKLMLTAALFAVVFANIKPLNVLALFAGFIAVQATSWLTPWLTFRNTRR